MIDAHNIHMLYPSRFKTLQLPNDSRSDRQEAVSCQGGLDGRMNQPVDRFTFGLQNVYMFIL